MTNPVKKPFWPPETIRAARRAELPPLLQNRGIELRHIGADNFELVAFRGLIVKHNYWRWPQHDMAGNTIDLLVKVLKLSFAEAMRTITAAD